MDMGCKTKFLILNSADERKSLRHREIVDEKWSGARGRGGSLGAGSRLCRGARPVNCCVTSVC